MNNYLIALCSIVEPKVNYNLSSIRKNKLYDGDISYKFYQASTIEQAIKLATIDMKSEELYTLHSEFYLNVTKFIGVYDSILLGSKIPKDFFYLFSTEYRGSLPLAKKRLPTREEIISNGVLLNIDESLRDNLNRIWFQITFLYASNICSKVKKIGTLREDTFLIKAQTADIALLEAKKFKKSLIKKELFSYIGISDLVPVYDELVNGGEILCIQMKKKYNNWLKLCGVLEKNLADKN